MKATLRATVATLATLVLVACGGGGAAPIVVPTGPAEPAPSASGATAPGATSAPRTSVTIGKRPLRTGDRRVEETTAEMALDLDVDAGAPPKRIATARRSRTEEQVLEAEAGTIRKLRVTFAEDEKLEGGAAVPLPTQGRTFVLNLRKGAIDVRDGDGKPVPPADAQAVAGAYDDLGKRDPLADAIPERPIAVGEEVPAMAKAIASMLGAAGVDPREKSEVESARVVLRDADVRAARFEVDLVLRNETPWMSMTMRLSGTLVIRVGDGRVAATTMSGPIEVRPAAQGGSAIRGGSGSLRRASTFTYDP